MKLAKSLLLGSAAAFVATTGYAADLPTKKAAPATYVKVCDAYGAGFFYIPGTDTCLKVSGRVRSDYAMSGAKDQFASNVAALQINGVNQNAIGLTGYGSGIYSVQGWNGFGSTTDPSGSSNRYLPNGVASGAANTYGWEARGRIDLDARSKTDYGTVQAVAAIRLARTTGVLDQTGPAASSSGAGATLEAAYIRFAGFTFGAARDNFSFMPSVFYGAGHWSSFANGAKQLAYTAVLGGGISATLAIQDRTDTTAGGANAFNTVTGGVADQYGSSATYTTALSTQRPAPVYNAMPQLNGRIDFDQSWGAVSVMGAVGEATSVRNDEVPNLSKTTYAVAAGLKLNLPMIASGDTLWLNAGYADGMTEYTTNWTSFKSSDMKRNVGGYVTNHPSWVQGTSDGIAKIETLKSWNVAAVMTHFWAPQWRSAFMGTYGAIEGTGMSKAQTFGYAGAFGDAKVWNVGTQLAFLPAKDFEIGVDVLYARVSQDIRRISYTSAPTTSAVPTNTVVTRETAGNWTGRLRVERTF